MPVTPIDSQRLIAAPMMSGSPTQMPSGMPYASPGPPDARRDRAGREVAERLVRARRDRPRASTAGASWRARTCRPCPCPPRPRWPASSWQYRKLSVVTSVVTMPPTGSQLLDAPVVLRGAALLLGVAGGGDAEAAEPAVGGVELGARARDRHPHRRVRLLHRLRQHVALGHREAAAVARHVARRPTSSGSTRTNSSQVFLVSSGSALKPPSSVQVEERAVPNSSRPPEMMSSAAHRSATRIGWFISGTQTTAPWPTRIRSVCAATAASTTSGAEQCEYSSRKWCSTAHTQSKPSSSARRACSSALR